MIAMRPSGLSTAALVLLGLVLGSASAAVIWLRPVQSAVEAPAQGTSTPIITPAPAPVVGATAPSFALATLDGKRVDLRALRGTPLVLNFWATWCEPCRTEMPLLQSHYEAGRSAGLRILAINFDEPEPQVRSFVDELGLTFDILLDPGAYVQDLYRVRGYPTTFFVDARGVIRGHKVGAMEASELEAFLADIGIGGP
ncbi:MAG: TlpA disulfide reductase family protein [Chloroflexi bacterium]|nr:TlpA disulfide reductase family protein [Chloroflexota bacterium]